MKFLGGQFLVVCSVLLIGCGQPAPEPWKCRKAVAVQRCLETTNCRVTVDDLGYIDWAERHDCARSIER